MLSKYNLQIDHSTPTYKDHGVYSSNLQTLSAEKMLDQMLVYKTFVALTRFLSVKISSKKGNKELSFWAFTTQTRNP